MNRWFAAALLVALTGLVTSSLQAGVRDELSALRSEVEQLKAGQEDIQAELEEIKKLLQQGARAGGQAAFRPRDLSIGDAFVLGDDTAPVTMFVYSDYQCPFCQRHATTVEPDLVAEYVESGKLRIVMREYPIENIHSRAMAASVAAVCAGHQGQYLGMHDRIFQDQKKLSDADLSAHAESLGLDMAAFDACVNDPGTTEIVRAHQKEAQGMGITGTPSFVLGAGGDRETGEVRVTRFIRGAQPLPTFQSAIEDLLEEAEGD